MSTFVRKGDCSSVTVVRSIYPATGSLSNHAYLFPFCKRSLPFLTVNVTIGNQAFSHDSCNIFPGLRYKK